MEHRRADLAGEFDRRLRDIRLGVYGARAVWQSISDAQRRVLAHKVQGFHLRRALDRCNRYDAVGADGTIRLNVCGSATVRNLTSRGPCHVDGGAFDPESSIILTECGQFVLARGRG